MKTANFQHKMDLVIDRYILKYIPQTAKPNYFSYFRIFCVPFIYLLLEHGNYILGFILFIIAACTDFIDGALARTRDQITDLGKLLDPIADKMLILTALLFIGFEYWIVKIFIVVILFEVLGVLTQALLLKYLGRPIPANVFGKVKMVLQSFCVAFFFVGYLLKSSITILLSEYILFVAFAFALVSAIEQTRLALLKVYKRNKASVK